MSFPVRLRCFVAWLFVVPFAAFASPYFKNIQATNGTIILSLAGLNAGQPTVLQSSTNLITWSGIATYTPSSSTLSVTNSTDGTGNKFYRFHQMEAASGTFPFFSGQQNLGSGNYYLDFDRTFFGYYSYSSATNLNHVDLGVVNLTDANDAENGIYFYDVASGHTWYTTPSQFPYFYDFTLQTFIYYSPDSNRPGHYTTNPRQFYNFATREFFTL